ncbi:MAG: PqqD family protein [Prevotella sp.]|nr:PqqD family protein [Prevotella sp.]
MKQKKGFVLRQVCGENVIVGEGLGAVNFGKLLALNETAAWLWQQAQQMGEFTVEELAKALCNEYEVTPDEAKADVARIVDEWKSVDVVE